MQLEAAAELLYLETYVEVGMVLVYVVQYGEEVAQLVRRFAET